jgi:hypothetical protein
VRALLTTVAALLVGESVAAVREIAIAGDLVIIRGELVAVSACLIGISACLIGFTGRSSGGGLATVGPPASGRRVSEIPAPIQLTSRSVARCAANVLSRSTFDAGFY